MKFTVYDIYIKSVIPEHFGGLLHQWLGQAVHTDYGADVEIVVPSDKCLVTDGAQARAVAEKKGKPELIEDLFRLFQHRFGGGHVHRLKYHWLHDWWFSCLSEFPVCIDGPDWINRTIRRMLLAVRHYTGRPGRTGWPIVAPVAYYPRSEAGIWK